MAKTQDRSPLTHQISEIKALFYGSREVSILIVDRSQNRASHCLANFARVEGRSVMWFGSGPECVLQAQADDLSVTLLFNISSITLKKTLSKKLLPLEKTTWWKISMNV